MHEAWRATPPQRPVSRHASLCVSACLLHVGGNQGCIHVNGRDRKIEAWVGERVHHGPRKGP
eukprot:2114-Eustigmatos_ZCMA.PRE.1